VAIGAETAAMAIGVVLGLVLALAVSRVPPLHARRAAGQPLGRPALCEMCVSRARLAGVRSVWVYPTGHIMRSERRLPSLAAWPQNDALTTFCGLPIWGHGNSRLYTLGTDDDW
jgi:hypothetical protein